MRISPFPKNWVKATLSQDLFEPFCLVAVVSSKGSVPRTTGAAMLVYQNQIMGSVGGGEEMWARLWSVCAADHGIALSVLRG